MQCLSTFSGCGWTYGFTFTSLPQQTLPQIFESLLKSYLMQVWKPVQYALLEAKDPFKLQSISMWYIYNRLDHLLRLWMGIWLHTYTVTTTDASPDLGKLAEILPDASVQTMPLYFGLGCRTFQTALHVHVIHIWGVSEPSQVADRHMATPSHHYHHRCFPRLGGLGQNPTWCKCANHATTLCLRLKNLSNCIPYPSHTYIRYLSTLSGYGWACGFHSHCYHHNTSPDFERLAEILPDANVQTIPLNFDCGYRTFQTASHIQVIHIWGIWAHYQVMDWHVASHSHCYHHNTSPVFERLADILPDANVQTIPLNFDWGYITLQTASHVNFVQ